MWMNEIYLMKTEAIRLARRSKGDRITFDCYHCIETVDREAYCNLHELSTADGGFVALSRVLNGTCFIACKKCKDFEGGQ